MFTLRRIIRNRKPLANYICTSTVIRSDESKKSDDFLDKIRTMKTSSFGKRREEDVVDSGKKIDSEGGEVTPDFKPSVMKKTKSVRSRPSRKKKPPKAEYKTAFFKNILASSAEKVAEVMGGDKEETKKDLLDYIKTFEVSKEKEKEELTEIFGKTYDSGTFEGMLFNQERCLDIFRPSEILKAENQVELTTWKALEAEDLECQSQKPPKNYFEELITWTKEGRLWHFPIDNDQGREKEAEISFTEHIFLEQHLEPWCPKQGPLRKFMELVLVGLSKNPYLTVEDKKEHIAWFEQYFENKKKLLKELGALGGTKQLKISDAEENS